MPETTEDAEMLDWHVSGKLFAKFGEKWYRIELPALEIPQNHKATVFFGGCWQLIATGPLLACIHACQEDADNARKEQGA